MQTIRASVYCSKKRCTQLEFASNLRATSSSTWGISHATRVNKEGGNRKVGRVEIGEREDGGRGERGAAATAGEAQRRRLNWHKQWLINIKLTFRTDSKRNLNSHTCVIKSAQRPSYYHHSPPLPFLYSPLNTRPLDYSERAGRRRTGRGRGSSVD